MKPSQLVSLSLSPSASHPIEGDRHDDALAAAQHNALRRVVRCLFAERIVDPDTLVFWPDGRGACLPLWSRQALVLFDGLVRAPADTYLLQGDITLVAPDGTRSRVDSAAQLLDVLRFAFDFTPSDDGVERLKADIANSIDNDALARRHRDTWNASLQEQIKASGARGLVDYLRRQKRIRDGAILLDQWGSLEGHPFYPTWKSKPDLSPSEVAALSPEFHATVVVRIAALRADMAHIERMPHVGSYLDWFAAHFPLVWQQWTAGLQARDLDPAAWLPLPLHSWHLERFVRTEYAQEIEDGILLLEGPDIGTWPTMSFRTMLPRLDGATPFIKLPVALWLTSEQRSLQAKSIHMGPRISTVIQGILEEEGGFDRTMEIFPEEVAFHYRHAVRQDDRPGRYLSVAYRGSRAAFQRGDGLFPVTVAALLTPVPGQDRPLLTELIEQGNGPATDDAVEEYFRRYARTVTHPVISIYLLYGIGLEAHQQNTAVLFSEDGLPRSLLIRDFGDGRTFAPLLHARGYALEPYVCPPILPTVFSDDITPVRNYVLDACFFCHLHEVALLLTRTYGLPDERLWDILAEETARAFDANVSRVEPVLWETERTAFLAQPWPTRSVLRMHLQNYADYRLQHLVSNPLRAGAQGADR